MKSVITLFIIGVLLLVMLAACGGGEAPGVADPAQTVERYLTAKVGRDADTVRTLLCAEMEADLERESHAFDTVSDARIEGLACEVVDGDTVRCDGRIVASYGAEETEFALGSYRVVEEDGEWQWCGEGE